MEAAPGTRGKLFNPLGPLGLLEYGASWVGHRVSWVWKIPASGNATGARPTAKALTGAPTARSARFKSETPLPPKVPRRFVNGADEHIFLGPAERFPVYL